MTNSQRRLFRVIRGSKVRFILIDGTELKLTADARKATPVSAFMIADIENSLIAAGIGGPNSAYEFDVVTHTGDDPSVYETPETPTIHI